MLELKNIKKSYKNGEFDISNALKGVSLTFDRNEFCFVLLGAFRKWEDYTFKYNWWT